LDIFNYKHQPVLFAAPSPLCWRPWHSHCRGLQIWLVCAPNVEAKSPAWLWTVYWRAIQAEAARRLGDSEGQCSFKSPFATPALPGDGHPQHCKVPEQHRRMAQKWRPMGQGEAQPPKIRRTDASTHEN